VKDFQIGEAKTKIRRTILKKRDRIDIKSRKDKSLKIGRRLRGLREYITSKTVMFYASFGSEVITDGIIMRALKDKKKVVLPVVDVKKGALCAYVINEPRADCKRSAFGIREPDTKKCRAVLKRDIDLVIVPGVSFDLNGSRLGFGKGFYDRWLKVFERSKRIGVCFEEQLVKKLPSASHDTPVGSIVTEKRILRTPQ
jgi:5-formyltetrahydrofolate cyclo-ligase